MTVLTPSWSCWSPIGPKNSHDGTEQHHARYLRLLVHQSDHLLHVDDAFGDDPERLAEQSGRSVQLSDVRREEHKVAGG